MGKLIRGINYISNKEYHGDREYLSSSNLKKLLEDPAAFYDERILGNEKPRKQSNALDEGSLTHTLILEPDNLGEEYVFFEGWDRRAKEFSSFKDALAANSDERTVITASQRMKCENLVKAYKKNKKAVELITGGEPEISICTELLDVPVKVRFDYINTEKNYILDIKTTSYSSDADTFKLTIKQFEYDLSAALYLEVAEQFYNKKFDFYFVVLSKSETTCDVFKLSDETRTRGHVKVLDALNTYKRCKESGIWKSAIVRQQSEEVEEV